MDLRDKFAQFWSAYPKRAGDRDKPGAWQAFQKYVTRGIDAEKIIACARKYAGALNGTDPKFVPQARTWLNRQPWEVEDDAPQFTEEELAAAAEKYRAKRIREGWL